MLKTLGAQIKEFKKDSFLTPVFIDLRSSHGDGHTSHDGIHYR